MSDSIAEHGLPELPIVDPARIRLRFARGINHVAEQHRVADQLVDQRTLDDLQKIEAGQVAHALNRGHIDLNDPLFSVSVAKRLQLRASSPCTKYGQLGRYAY